MLYFAYGSNLHHFQMKRRCKDSIFLKKINLKNFKLTLEVNIEQQILKKNRIQLYQVDFLKYQKVMKKNWMFMKITQSYTKSFIFTIMEKK